MMWFRVWGVRYSEPKYGQQMGGSKGLMAMRARSHLNHLHVEAAMLDQRFQVLAEIGLGFTTGVIRLCRVGFIRIEGLPEEHKTRAQVPKS